MFQYDQSFFKLASDVSDVCEAENKATESTCNCSETDNTAAIIGGVVAVVFMIITALTVIVIVVLILRSRSGNYLTTKTRYVQ